MYYESSRNKDGAGNFPRIARDGGRVFAAGCSAVSELVMSSVVDKWNLSLLECVLCL